MIGRSFALVSAMVGAAVLFVSVPMVRAAVEPFLTWYYAIAWFGLILFVDSVRFASGKTSLIYQRPLVFLALLFWSSVLWFLFEALNFRLANWYYVFVPDTRWERIAGSWLSFATVLPALFLIEKLLEDMGLFARTPRFSLVLGPKGTRRAAILGALCLALPLVFPRHAFPLIWAFGFLLPLPLTRRLLDGSPEQELEAGRPGRILRILVAGLLCGFIWEFLNAFARTRWIYTVPFFEELKLFEMPIAGFLGFPPFALECVVLYGALVGLGIAPEWEGFKRRAGKRPRPIPAAAAGLYCLVSGFCVLLGMERYSIDSYIPRPEKMGLPEAVVELAREYRIRDGFALRELLDDPLVLYRLKEAEVDVPETLFRVDLALLRGIGAEHAKALVLDGVHSMADLASCEPERLATDLGVPTARAKVWIRAARKKSPGDFFLYSR